LTVRDSLLPPVTSMLASELLVLADVETCTLIERELSAMPADVTHGTSIEQAIVVANERAGSLDCILVDFAEHPDGAWELLKQLRQVEETASIPVVAILADALDEDEELRLIDAGVTDRVTRPLRRAVLCAKVKAIVARSRVQRELKQKLRFALEYSAQDALTGLYNRRYFERRIREESEHARRHKRPFSVVLVDLDNFKLVNDRYGHEEGDRVLCHVAELLLTSLREDDIVCRFGGEEFVILLRATPAPAARLVANRVREALAWAEIPLGPKNDGADDAGHLTLSAGIASVDERNNFDLENLLDRADKALYRAKRGGRNRIELE
jgi:two-component system cell cycle response regulator